jgi:hypothetical protein
MRTTPAARIAAILLVLEGLAVGVIVLRQVVAITTGDTGSIESAIALIVLTAIGAIALIAFGVAVWRGQSWGRSGGIVFQVLILAIAIGAATGDYAHPLTALAITVPAVVVLVLLVVAARRAAPPRNAEDEASR